MATTRRILAFDSSCGRCRKISAGVAQACSGKLEVLPLAHPDVARWRMISLGPDPRWAPTLLEVSEESVRAWTGLSMAGPLIRALGPRSTINVLRALGRQRGETIVNDGAPGGKGVLGRAVTQFGSGLLVAGGLVVSGMLSVGPDPARSWVKANANQLPQSYDDLVSHPMDYRKAIFEELAPAVRSSLWVEHLRRYRQEHPNLSAAQKKVLDSASAMAADESNFVTGSGISAERDSQFRSAAQDAFGHEAAAQIFAVLGPSDASQSDEPQPTGSAACTCASSDDWCGNRTSCNKDGCNVQGGCGTMWSQVCDGLCA